MVASREIHLASRPHGLPTTGDFALVTVETAPLREDEVLVRNLVMSVDPYMRGRMNEGKSYVPPFAVGKPLDGAAIGEVVESRSAALPIGTIVSSTLGWRDYAVAAAKELHAVDRSIKPLSVHLGALGMTGMTAWIGLRVVEAKAGDVVYISGAAGAVGSVAGQLAKKRGCRVIGSAGSADKVEFLIGECGFDAAFNYRLGPIVEQLAREAPDGLDVYFDNVGGQVLEACLFNMKDHGRIACCGAASQYDGPGAAYAPRGVPGLIVTKRLVLRGFVVMDFEAGNERALADLRSWVESGKLKVYEDIIDGFENLPQALIGLLAGENVGKRMVRVV